MCIFFSQLYTIHGEVKDITAPLVYCLLPDKLQSTYETAFGVVQRTIRRKGPKDLLIDFEPAAVNAVRTVFKGTEVHGCNFHFNKCLMRKIQSNGLKKKYENNEAFAVSMKMLASLAFVPVKDVS